MRRSCIQEYRIHVLVAFLCISTICFLGFQVISLSSAIVPDLADANNADQAIFSKVSTIPKDKRLVIFPRYFHLYEKLHLIDYYVSLLDGGLPAVDDTNFFSRFATPPDLPVDTHHQMLYASYRFKIFDSNTNISDGKGQCLALEAHLALAVSNSSPLDSDLHSMVEKLARSDYFKEIEPLFESFSIQEQLDRRVTHEHWFRFAGAAIYLKDYGVYYMVSRVVYSKAKSRTRPTVSLVYGEVYDEEWNLIPDIDLVVPSNTELFTGHLDDSDSKLVAAYAIYNAPGFVKVPIYHKSKLMETDFYGPEDPRIIAVISPRGHEEPIITFNSNHRKLERADDKDVGHVSVDLLRHRSMFQCYPWQFSRGRSAIDELPSSEQIFQDHDAGELMSQAIYHRIVELRIAKFNRPGTQKNWTPFVSETVRDKFGHDRYLYYMFRWRDMEVLRCRLYDPVQTFVSSCEFVYKRDFDKWITDKPGPFRGGTNLVNINLLLQQHQQNFPEIATLYDNLKTAGREVWVGFARAHISNCGCGGGSFYRPNLVVLTREEGDQFKALIVSNFVAFGINVPGWDLNKSEEVCNGGNSVLIPNSISQWQIHNARKVGDNYEIDDYMLLVYSVSDVRTSLIYVRGLLGAIVALDEYPQNKLFQIFGPDHMVARGYDNENIECAINSAYEYCKEYGQLHKEPILGE